MASDSDSINEDRRYCEHATEIVRQHTGRSIIPSELDTAVHQIAGILYQRRVWCCDENAKQGCVKYPRELVKQLDAWRL